MKFSPKHIPYLSFHLSLLPHTNAFIEPETASTSPVSQAAFLDTAALPPTQTQFISPDEILTLNGENDTTYNLQENALNMQPNSGRIDVRSGKVVSFDLSQPILPGDGVGNHLLWRVGMMDESETSVVMEREEWGRIGVEAVKVSDFILCIDIV